MSGALAAPKTTATSLPAGRGQVHGREGRLPAPRIDAPHAVVLADRPAVGRTAVQRDPVALLHEPAADLLRRRVG